MFGDFCWVSWWKPREDAARLFIVEDLTDAGVGVVERDEVEAVLLTDLPVGRGERGDADTSPSIIVWPFDTANPDGDLGRFQGHGILNIRDSEPLFLLYILYISLEY